jgi:hypothetical protein
MALQTDNLVMVGRGILNDHPVNALQPPLWNGIHLRYGFARERGFPWYGYYLFRRPHQEAERTCVLPPQIRTALEPDAASWKSPQGGVFYSDGPLKLDDSFAPAGQLEFDLRASKACFFALPPGQTAREFQVEIGLYGAKPIGTVPPATSPANPAQLLGSAPSASSPALPPGKPLPPPSPVLPPGKASPAPPAALPPGTAPPGVPPAPLPRPFDPIEIKIVVTGYNGKVPVAQTEISGLPGQIVTAVLSADVMDGVLIAPNSCALIEVCFVPTLASLQAGWQLLTDFPYPLCLPNAQAAYPCAGKPANATLALAMAKSRVRYGALPIWDDGRFVAMTSLLDELLTGGPSAGAMDARVAPDSVPGGSSDDPQMPAVYPLDLLVFGSLQPAVAQVLGLYWVDQTAANNVAYDYVILADHDNSFKGSSRTAFDAIAAGTLPANVDGWVCFNLKTGTPPTLAAPGGPLCYGLPGGVVASSAPGWVAPAGTNTVGVRWTLPTTTDNQLLPGGPIYYHLWRADLAATAPTAAPPVTAYTLLTADAPIIVADVAVPANTTLQNASDWPPFRLFAYDRLLVDGWYSYRLAGVDIFGQYSALSDPAQWYQWAPAPTPRPWYYVGTGSDAVLNAYAVHVRDTTPPPAPPGVEAYALDPLDPMLIQDAPFAAWLAGGWWNNLTASQKAGHIGLRVTWRWTQQQMLQAPDTREFRIYFNPTGDPPAPDSGVATNWSARIFVVAYGTNMSVDANSGDQTYDVLLPLLNDASFGGVPLAPDNANPVVYGQVGVSAADNKTATADSTKWPTAPFGNRTGNEGRVGVPAKIYRVLRAPPPPPGIADPSAKVWATPADYHSQSYYTFRWPKPLADATLIDAHIFRAMDETLFEYDFRQRPRQPLDANNPNLFPVTGWNTAGIKAELDALNALTPILAGDTAAAITAKIRAALPSYRTLSDNALRTLASLPADTGSAPKPGNDGAFSQITYQPLHHGDKANADRIGPDGAETYVPAATLCAYLAELDGRSAQNRYFFRVAFVNAAHDMGALGPSSPPVYLPKVEPPRTPVITSILGGDLQITISFAANREADLAEYRIYRADNARSARDIRLMTLVATIPQSAIDLTQPFAVWTDNTNLVGGTQYFYRMVSVDTAGNVSPPTALQPGVPIDTRIPTPPYWIDETWLLRNQSDKTLGAWPANGIVPAGFSPALRLGWQSNAPNPTFAIGRHVSGANLWTAVSAGPASAYATANSGEYSWVDDNVDPHVSYAYRMRVQSGAGVWSIDYRELDVVRPPLAEAPA